MAALEQNPADELVDYEEDEQQNDAKVRKIPQGSMHALGLQQHSRRPPALVSVHHSSYSSSFSGNHCNVVLLKPSSTRLLLHGYMATGAEKRGPPAIEGGLHSFLLWPLPGREYSII